MRLYLRIENLINHTLSRGFPVAEDFSKLEHGLDDMEVRCVKQCRSTDDARRRDEMRLIFHLGTFRPHGINVDFIL